MRESPALRASKRFNLRANRQVEVTFDLYNALNTNSAISISSASGPTFGVVSGIGAAAHCRRRSEGQFLAFASGKPRAFQNFTLTPSLINRARWMSDALP
jgi:hypothetical protein